MDMRLNDVALEREGREHGIAEHQPPLRESGKRSQTPDFCLRHSGNTPQIGGGNLARLWPLCHLSMPQQTPLGELRQTGVRN